jgi:hypothetical protein
VAPEKRGYSSHDLIQHPQETNFSSPPPHSVEIELQEPSLFTEEKGAEPMENASIKLNRRFHRYA